MLRQLRVAVSQCVIDVHVLQLDPAHQQVLDQLVEFLLTLGDLYDLQVPRHVVRLYETIDRFCRVILVRVRVRQSAPHFRLVRLLRELMGPVHLVQVLQQHVHCLHVHVELLVDRECLLLQLVLLAQCQLRDIRPIEIVQSVDVVKHLALIALDGRDDQQVLQFLVLPELRVMQHQLLQQPKQLVRDLRLHERLNRNRHLVHVPRVL